MTEHIKYFAKLSSISIFSFLKINFLGSFTTIIIAIIGFINLTKDINVGSSGHVSAIPFVVMTFANRPIGSILWLLICTLSPFLFFALGNKYILNKIANKLVNEKFETLIYPLLDKVLNKFVLKQNGLIKNGADFSVQKLKLIQNIKNESENKLLKRVIVYGLKKIKIDDIDFNQKDLNFNDVIKQKTTEALKYVTEPDRKPIFFIIAGQLLILLFILFTKY